MFRIGDFSRLSRVSVKMLRHYDERGLLKPVRVDPATDYRYYAADQLPRLNRIIALKDLGFTLDQIARLLEEDLSVAQLRNLLVRRRVELEAELSRQRAQLADVEARLRQIEREEPLLEYEVVLRAVAPQPVAAIRDVLPSADGVERLFHEIETYVARHGARAASPPLTVYHDAEYRDHDVDVTVAVPVAAPLPGGERVAVDELPGVATMACVVHAGDYAGIGAAANALLGWIAGHGYRIAGPLREVYLRHGVDGLPVRLPAAYLTHRPEDYVTELQLPVAPP